MSMAPSNIATGTEVFTTDGQSLGTVKTVRGDQFEVNAPMQMDYWLPCDCVDSRDSSDGRRLTVSFSKDRLDDYKQDATDDER